MAWMHARRPAAVPIDLRLSEPSARSGSQGRARSSRSRCGGSGPIGASSILGGDPVVAVMHTSGTTAAPKPVELTYGNFLASALGSAVALGLDPAERWLCPMPLTHVGGLSIPIRSAIYATTAVLHGRFETEAVLNELMDPGRRITLVSLVPTMLARLLDAGLSSGRRRCAGRCSAAGPIAPALLERAAGRRRAGGADVRDDRGVLADRDVRLAAARRRRDDLRR